MKNQSTIDDSGNDLDNFRDAYFRMLNEEQPTEVESKGVENDSRYRFVPHKEKHEH